LATASSLNNQLLGAQAIIDSPSTDSNQAVSDQAILARTRSNQTAEEQTADHQAAQPISAPFTFLRLIPELRNMVYEMVVQQDSYVVLKPRGLLASSRLCAVNHQVKDEYLAILEGAPEVLTTVFRWDFGPLVTALNRLSEQHIKKLSTSGGSSRKRTITVKIQLPHATQEELDAATTQTIPPSGRSQGLIARWLNRFNSPAKRGIALNFSYVIVKPPHNFYLDRWNARVALRLLRKMEHEYEGRAKVEVAKMLSAIQSMGSAI
jgi:hypothetical protein